MQQTHALSRDQRRFFGRLRQNRIAGNQRRRDLTDEDGEREIPGADTDDRTERHLAGLEVPAGFRRIITQEVDGLAHFGNGVRHGFSRLAHDEAEQGGHFGLHGVGGTLQAGGAFFHRGGRPVRGCCPLHGGFDIGLRRFCHMADNIIVVAGIENRARVATCLWRCGFPFGRSTCFQGIVQCRERRFTGKIEAAWSFYVPGRTGRRARRCGHAVRRERHRP